MVLPIALHSGNALKKLSSDGRGNSDMPVHHVSTHIESTSSIMKRLLIITLSLILCSCGANYHLRRMEYHELKALAKGAKLKESVRTETDTIYRDTTIYVDGETLDETFSFVDRDTVYLESKEGVKAKLSIDSRKKTGSAAIDCPEKIVKVPQKYYVNRKFYINRKYQAGLPLWKQIGLGIFFFLLGFMVCDLYHRFRRKPAP